MPAHPPPAQPGGQRNEQHGRHEHRRHLVDQALHGRLKDAGIDYDLRSMDKPSDHAPIWLELG